MIHALLSIAHAAGLAAQLDATEVAAGQSVGLTVQVTDAEIARPPVIDAPAGLTIRYLTRARSRQMYNFDVTETQTFRYEVSATTAGVYSIGPLAVKTAAGVLHADALELRVAERDAGGVDALAADLSHPVAWVGQVLVYHLRFKTPRSLVNVRWGPPEDERLTPEPGVDPLTSEYRLGSGKDALAVAELWYPMRAKASGRGKLGGATLLGQFAVQRRRGSSDPFLRDLPGFTDLESETVVSEPLALEVRDLPPAGRPADFSGLVGSFTLRATPSATTVQVGDTVTVDIELAGDGALAGVVFPAWTGDGFRVYDDSPAIESQIRDGHFAATARAKRAVVPERPGTLVLPAVRQSWFDPARGEYVVEELPPITLTVGGAAEAAAVEAFGEPDARKTAVDSLGEDILPVRTDVSLGAPWPGAWAALLCVPGGALLAWEFAPRLRRRARPGAEPQRFGFADLAADREARLAGLERIFREEAARRLRRPEPELKREDVATLGEAAVGLYRQLDQARYRGDGGLPEAEVRAWVESR